MIIIVLVICGIYVVASLLKMYVDHLDYNRLVKSFNGLKDDYKKLLEKEKPLKETDEK